MKKLIQFFFLLGSFLIFCLMPLSSSHALPLKTTILNAKDQMVATALVYIDFVEILDLSGKSKGKVGIVNLNGNYELFIVKEDETQNLVGRAMNTKLYSPDGKLIGYYGWTTFWVYAYAPDGKKLGRAKCIAFRGICAAGVAAYLTQLLTLPYTPKSESAAPLPALA